MILNRLVPMVTVTVMATAMVPMGMSLVKGNGLGHSRINHIKPNTKGNG